MSHQMRGVIVGEMQMCSTWYICLLMSFVGDSHGVSEMDLSGLRLIVD